MWRKEVFQQKGENVANGQNLTPISATENPS
jgi:hypothetical protein